MTTIALAPAALPRPVPVSAPRCDDVLRGARGAGVAASLITSFGALLIATALHTGATTLGAADYTVIAETLVAHEGGLVTVLDGRY